MKPSAPLALALCLTLPLPTFAQQTTPFPDPANLRGERVNPTDGHELPVDQGTLGLQQLLRKLNTRASILNIVAHPDDEDGGMLTLYARGFGARVIDLSLTRGEGGQNFVTGDFEDALGLIRTQELLANDRYTGVNQLFGTEVDFGFSKTKEEAFAKWTHERVLYDAVRAIRLVRPLVITATFIGNVTDGHGQHQVSGEIAQEAFQAAADPNVFPDQIAEGLLPWQALRVYARVPFADINAKGVYDYATNQYVPARFTNYVTGNVTTTKPPADITVPEGTPDPLLTPAAANASDLPANATNNSDRASNAASSNTPFSYAQFSRIGLFLQRSQIGKSTRLPTAGIYNSGYTLYGSVLCNDPATARPPSLTEKTCYRPQVPARSITTATTSPAPKARPITAQGEALGIRTEETPRAESPIQNPAITTQPNFFTGIDTSIEGIATLAPSAFPPHRLSAIANAINTATNHFDPAHPDAIAPDLAAALSDLDKLINSIEHWNGDPTQKANALHELSIKRVQLNDALALALGVHLDATAPSSELVENSTPAVKTRLTEESGALLMYETMDIYGAGGGRGQSFHDSITPQISSSHPLDHDWQILAQHLNGITEPYFYRDNIEQPVYKLRDSALRNAAQTPAPFTALATVTYQGAEITLARVVHNGPQPISIIPPVSIASAPSATVLPNGQTTAQLTATLRTDANTPANINVQSPHNWSIEAKAAGSNSVNFFLHPTAPIIGPQLFHVTAQTPDHHTYTEGFRTVGYPGLIATNYYTPATTRVVPVDLKLPSHVRIAYLPGTGDAVPEALASIGLAPTMIKVADLTPAKLASYDTVILGVRAYTANPDLHGAPSAALLDFARNGGNVLVQYQTSDFTSADTPYPLSLGDALGSEKVVDETAPVQLLSPTNPLLNTPNQITPADFNNWIAERGHGFLGTWDPHYAALTETHDPGGPVTPAQLPQRGGLITSQVGKGRWTYCAFALYRQLPEAVPGAFRLFVNLLAPAR
jgi:LmbE family N-acetylglucosaminyl deacetylase